MFIVLAAMCLLPASPMKGEVKIEISQLHMCCDGCASEVEALLKKVEGVGSISVTKKSRTAVFIANDAKSAQRALDALADDGFHGRVSDKSVAFKNDSGVSPGKVTSLTVTGFHNTCPGCVKSFRVALKKVPGVTGDDCKPNVTTCTIKGNFDATAVIKALHEEGFHAKVKR
jgi:mercuric ion binding protein